jgi:hypothetical protein
MNAKTLLARFAALRNICQQPCESQQRANEIAEEWNFLYDQACEESGSEASKQLTDDEFDMVCNGCNDFVWGCIHEFDVDLA